MNIVNPTNNQTPDATLGGNAVTGITNTGHGSTSTSSSAAVNASDADEKSARWFGFQNIGGERKSVRLKLSWTTDGSANASDDGLGGSGDGSAQFIIEYSLNGGANWTTIVTDSATISSPPGGGPDTFDNDSSADIALPNNQDLSQVQVRVDYLTSANASGGVGNSGTGSVTNATISDIRIEVMLVAGGLISMM